MTKSAHATGETRQKARPKRRAAAAKRVAIQASSPALKRPSGGSTAKSLRKSATGWAGDDIEEIIAIVAASRSKIRF